MRYRSGIGRDQVGYFAYWGEALSETSYETLRTPNREKAELWLIQGNCHGAPAHYKSCPNCEEPER